MSFELHKDNRSPSIGETISVGGEPFNLAGCTAKLKMRPELAATPLKVDADAEIVSASTSLDGDHELPEHTLTVDDTAGFLDEGALELGGQIVFYAGKTATTFLGCTRGFGTVADGESVSQIGAVRYDWVAEDVDTGGNFRAWFEVTLPSGKTQDTPELDVTILEHAPVAGALCALVDVLRYVPGYESEPAIDELLEELIAGESLQIRQDTGREIVGNASAPTRLFEIRSRNVRTRRVWIGEAAEISAVRILDADADTEISTVSASHYAGLPRTRETWEPIRQLWFAPTSYGGPTLEPCRFLEVTGTWGYPQVPANLRQACAKMVITRTVGNPAFSGTSFSQAIEESDVNIGILLASAREAIRRHMDMPAA